MPQLAGQKRNFKAWLGNEEEGEFYSNKQKAANKEYWGNKKKKQQEQKRIWTWDDVYDPTTPNTYATYKKSDESIQVIDAWKTRLYAAHAKKNGIYTRPSSGAYSSEDEEERMWPDREPPFCRDVMIMLMWFITDSRRMDFAPPSDLNFAPPSFDDHHSGPSSVSDVPARYKQSNSPADTPTGHEEGLGYRSSFALPAEIPNDATGEDAYARRMRMSGMTPAQPEPSPPAAPMPGPTFVPARQELTTSPEAPTDFVTKKALAQAKVAAIKAKLDAAKPKANNTPPAQSISPTPPPIAAPMHQMQSASRPQPANEPPGIISRAPVRYELPAKTPDNLADEMDTTEDSEIPASASVEQDAPDQPRSNKPGQKGFAERLLMKYGWEKGQGLGAQGEGITTAIIAKADKRKKLPDSRGGGFAAPANMGKIVGGKKRKVENPDNDDGKFGQMSQVIKLEGMLKGLDIEEEIQDKNLMQEIGDEMGNKYGTVERLFIWREEMGGHNEVFVKFTSQVSALRAVNDTEGVSFAGNEIMAKFWDVEKFENGEYE